MPYNMNVALNCFHKCGDKLLENKPFVIDDSNISLIKNLIRYMHGDPSFPGDLTKGIALIGPTGTGKTLLFKIMSLYRNVDAIQYVQRGVKKHLYFPVRDTTSVVARFVSYGWDDLEQVKTCNCLCLDDLGKERREVVHFGNRINVVREIINERHRRSLLTFFTSNYPKPEMAEIYGDEIESRMHEMFSFIEVTGPDRRKL